MGQEVAEQIKTQGHIPFSYLIQQENVLCPPPSLPAPAPLSP